MIGIYLITNKINGRHYVGQSIDIARRWRQHREIAPCGQTPLYKAIQKYGIENFEFCVLEECSKEELNDKEIQYIEQYNSYFGGYNQTRGGDQYSHNVKLTDNDFDKIIDLLKNTTITQKEIAEIFSVGEDTISEINTGKSRHSSQLVYPIRVNYIKNLCIDCGTEILSHSKRCALCNSKLQRRVERPSKEVLYQEIKATNFSAVGRKYGVSDNAIRKWCKFYGLPTKSSEYKREEP